MLSTGQEQCKRKQCPEVDTLVILMKALDLVFQRDSVPTTA